MLASFTLVRFTGLSSFPSICVSERERVCVHAYDRNEISDLSRHVYQPIAVSVRGYIYIMRWHYCHTPEFKHPRDQKSRRHSRFCTDRNRHSVWPDTNASPRSSFIESNPSASCSCAEWRRGQKQEASAAEAGMSLHSARRREHFATPPGSKRRGITTAACRFAPGSPRWGKKKKKARQTVS